MLCKTCGADREVYLEMMHEPCYHGHKVKDGDILLFELGKEQRDKPFDSAQDKQFRLLMWLWEREND